jgi:Asp-tRNA(Asn)/Glu-tRNA(Gln) amidotransferase C subunit
MPTDIDDAAIDHLLARAELQLTDEQKAELMTVYAGIAAMAERVRKPRGHMAELAHVYNFTEEDLV